MLKVSIVIPVYNREKSIAFCINSILKQDYKNIEIIVVNDGSNDNSYNIINRYVKNNKNLILYNIKNSGASAARNYGLNKATGDYICFIDSDDYIAKDYISTLVLGLETYDTDMAQYYDFVRTRNYNHFLKESKKTRFIKIYQKNLFDEFFRVNGESDKHTLWNKIYKRNILSNFSLEEGRMNEDVLGVYDILSNVKTCTLILEKKYYYYQNVNGVTKTKFKEKDLDLLYMWECVVKKTKKEYPEYYKYALINQKRANFTLLSKMLISGYDKNNEDIKKIKKWLKRELRKNFFALLQSNIPFNRKILLIYINYFF